MRRLGIDEAGRGCVLGPLVVAAFLVDTVDDEVLKAAGAADSKLLSAAARDRARERLSGLGRALFRRVAPREIDRGNLDALEAVAIADLVRDALAAGPLDVVVIDALGAPVTLPARMARLREATGYDGTLLCVPKADRDHPIVGAASIHAKTERDAALAADAAGHDVGTGYPSDPRTRAFIATMGASGTPWPSFVRTRWATVRTLGAQTALFRDR
jgi:ribonuclease H